MLCSALRSTAAAAARRTSYNSSSIAAVALRSSKRPLVSHSPRAIAVAAFAAPRPPLPLPLAQQRRVRSPSFSPFSHSPSSGRATMASAVSSSKLDLEVVEIENPNGLNFILGHSHFIKTVEDLAEVMAQAGGGAKWGLAFCEASGDPDNADMPGRKVRFDGNDDALTELAKRNAMEIGAGHSFIIFMDGAFPVSVLNAVKAVPEVCRVHCATANPTAVVVANVGGGGGRSERRAVLGVADGLCPVAFETDGDKEKRKAFLRMIGYKR